MHKTYSMCFKCSLKKEDPSLERIVLIRPSEVYKGLCAIANFLYQNPKMDLGFFMSGKII